MLAVFALALYVYGKSTGQTVTVAFLCYATAWRGCGMPSTCGPLASFLGLEVPASAQAWVLAAMGGLAPLVIGQIALVFLKWRGGD